jgi:hypothetical protein
VSGEGRREWITPLCGSAGVAAGLAVWFGLNDSAAGAMATVARTLAGAAIGWLALDALTYEPPRFGGRRDAEGGDR